MLTELLAVGLVLVIVVPSFAYDFFVYNKLTKRLAALEDERLQRNRAEDRRRGIRGVNQ